MSEIKRGDFVIVSSGEYSDYGVMCFAEAKTDFVPLDLVPKFKTEVKPRWKDSWDEGEFGDWLINNGYLKKLRYKELYLGDYGSLKLSVSEHNELLEGKP